MWLSRPLKFLKMSKVLLINPPFNIAKENYDSSVSVGLLSIASYLDSQGVLVTMIDGARQEKYLELIKEEIKNCAWVGISVMTTQIPGALKISRLIREINPSCKIIWGGSHPTFFIRQTVEHNLVDVVVYGEGELTMGEIVQGKNLSEIKGIAFKKDGRVMVNLPQELHNPASLPLFNWSLVPVEILKNLQLIPSLTSRGCPHRCTFCINAILKNRWRFRTVEQVLADLKNIKQNEYFKNKKLRFWDENFFVDKNRARLIVEGMIRENLIIPWETTVRADYLREEFVDDDFMSKLKQSGCYLLSFGAESGSPRILKKIKKDITPDQVVASARMCLKYGIIPQYSFMVGLPGEEKRDMMMTLKLIDRLAKLSEKVQILGPQAFRPYPGSTLYEECLAAGWQAPQTLEEWNHLVENQLSYLDVKNFSWVKEKDLVDSLEAYARFGAHSIKSALGSSVSANKILKLGFILVCQLRWKLKFFKWPVEFKLAKKFVTS
ncbi:MAG: Fe-S protein, radical SAM family [Candidatus Magasanikbacteria bacterium GW2011_GWC2_40_17]|uniref:Fe-S protein, radical SAM family n=1 Tax=Candidatus Magasanikbacteria bacterium GW2011_GWA2_42_32 TaxID=1619039 RepID=A0A0G1A8L6_9BACT|nr:MAG: Fe-S protein, radical SAM family [Candidatus Magasanikbacteria bacterium GW2011_GWC2_40_17]KKS57375.1 MAG: Fe-S protein, radical SAM family [Candidatus Magasanikbacteria bacterium GW2011_GWA2_42_32]